GGRELRAITSEAYSQGPDVAAGVPALSADGRLVATCGRWLGVWDVQTGRRVRSLAPSAEVNSEGGAAARVWVAPDGKAVFGRGVPRINRGADGFNAPGARARVAAWDVWDDEVLTIGDGVTSARPLRFVRDDAGRSGDHWLLAAAVRDYAGSGN